MTPPDPFSMRLRDLGALADLAQRFRALPEQDRHNQLQLLTMSAIDFLDQWFETDVLKATMSASGIIGTFLGVRSPGTAYVLLHHYMGDIDGAFRSWGLSKGGTGRVSEAIAAAARAAGAEIRLERAGAAHPGQRRRSDGRRARERRLPHGVGRPLERRSATDVHEDGRRRPPPGRLRRGHPALQVPRLVRQGQPRARRPAGLHVPARVRARICAARSRFRRASTTWSARTTRRSTAGTRASRTSTSSSRASPIRRSRRPGKHVMSCFVQYAPYDLNETLPTGRRRLGRPARGVRRHGHRHDLPSTRRTSTIASCTGRC